MWGWGAGAVSVVYFFFLMQLEVLWEEVSHPKNFRFPEKRGRGVKLESRSPSGGGRGHLLGGGVVVVGGVR